MSASPPPPGEVVGIQPWLPWPLSAWSWWTVPVRAERLAALRIGVAACLLFDILYNYFPDTLAYFGKDTLAYKDVFNYRFQAPRMCWSLLRGVGDEATQYLALIGLTLTTLWILGTSFARLCLVRKDPPPNDRTGFALVIWIFTFAWYVVSQWSQLIAANAFNPEVDEKLRIDYLAWVLPMLGFAVVCMFFVLDIGQRLRNSGHRIPWIRLGVALWTASALVTGGLLLTQIGSVDKNDKAVWLQLLRSWQHEDWLVMFAMWLWIGFTGLLLIGWMSRFTAVVCWLISMSFANANPYLDNAGDTIRLILLFYLMLSPCGAAWSIDALIRRRNGPVYVHPWPLCLIFVQMIFIYFMNGLYKLFGASWLEGNSLFWVLGDAVLTRFSQVALPIPHAITRMMTWSVLAWEVSFPLLVIFKWPRILALVMGVMFHLGIFATMELGGFVPYALCMYLPLAPWERVAAPFTFRARAAAGERETQAGKTD